MGPEVICPNSLMRKARYATQLECDSRPGAIEAAEQAQVGLRDVLSCTGYRFDASFPKRSV